MNLAVFSHAITRTLTTLTLLLILAGATNIARADDTPAAESRSKGAHCLFAGHSFFCPVAMNFDRIARKSDFPDHEMKIVFRGGRAGTASALWNSPSARKAIEAILATGDIEIFGLTPDVTDTAETFEPWFDLALEHNPDTRFFIGIPWARGGPETSIERYNQMIDLYAAKADVVVKELRERYPDKRIDHLAYGKIASAMKRGFESESLPDIKMMVGPGSDALFLDKQPGHAGPMLLKVCALTWLNQLYAADLDSLNYGEHQSDVPAIIEEVMIHTPPLKVQPDAPTGETEAIGADEKKG
ncbi:MAG: hypothetical protein P8J45_05525 [Phycisphaerales bacterium]|jgi:hypothetical protein|nr:hypothetical protein [Phycisphaerales bacterium]